MDLTKVSGCDRQVWISDR